MLTITLLRECELALEPASVVVLHDPVGLTGDRVLAHVYRAAAQRISESATEALPAGSALQWLVVRPPLSRVWDDLDTLGRRAWRSRTWYERADRPRTAPVFPAAPPSTRDHMPRVAETPQPTSAARDRSAAHPAVSATSTPNVNSTTTVTHPSPLALLLISEADQPSAISSLAAARLLARALRRQWAVLATTREGPLRLAPAGSHPQQRPWVSHLVCQGGVLRPVAPS